MQKVPGVERVRVSLKDGLTILDLKADNAVTIANLRQIIKNNGFVSKEIDVRATGAPKPVGGGPGFEIARTGETVPATASPRPDGDRWQFTVPAPGR